MLETMILGAGAAGTGPLVQAAGAGTLRDWLRRGVAVVDRSDRMGGSVGNYALNADTLGGTFLECLDGGDPASPLRPLRDDPVTRALETYRGSLPPLPLVGRFLSNVSAAVASEIARTPGSRFFGGTEVRSLRLMQDGSVSADLLLPNGRRHELRAASAVLALGGRVFEDWEGVQLAPGLRLDRWRGKLMAANALLSQGGAARGERALRRRGGAPQAVILGGSHSAFSAAWTLLERCNGVKFATAGVHILHRETPRVFYASRDAAAADGYAFGPDDVCPQTGRVNRLGGLRGDGREVWRRIHGLTGAPADGRVAIQPLHGIAPAKLRALLDAAGLIVPAFGYRLATVPIFAADGRRIMPALSGPSVDSDSRLMRADGPPLANVFGIGLGSGFRPWGAMAGEPSFQGQQNSLWLYQNGLGELIHEGVRRYAEEFRAAAAASPRSAGLGALVATARGRLASLL
jgi:hypothetical protein